MTHDTTPTGDYDPATTPDGPAAQMPADEAGEPDGGQYPQKALNEVREILIKALREAGVEVDEVQFDSRSAIYGLTHNGVDISLMANLTP